MKELMMLAMLAIPAAFAAWTITQEEIFQDFREWLETACKDRCYVAKKLAFLPTCYFCTGTWTGFFFLMLCPMKFVSQGIQGYLLAWFTLAAIEQVYLTSFHILRVLLRWARANADAAEGWQ